MHNRLLILLICILFFILLACTVSICFVIVDRYCGLSYIDNGTIITLDIIVTRVCKFYLANWSFACNSILYYQIYYI